MVLSAGLGLRLRPLTLIRAKPALPVAGEPLVRRIIRGLAAGGVSDVVLNLHHLPATIAAAVGDGSDINVRARYSWEQPEILGSAGGIRQALTLLEDDPFFIVNGDTLSEVDLRALYAAHLESAPLVTMALMPNVEPSRYGGVRLDGRGHVTGFVARGPAATGSFHFVGVQVASRAAFQALRPGEAANSVGGVYDRLIAQQPGSIAGVIVNAPFWDIGTVADYLATSRAFAANGEGRDSRSAAIDPTARLTRTIVWDDIEVRAGASLDGCIVTDGVTVPAGSTYQDAILLRGPDGIQALPLQAPAEKV